MTTKKLEFSINTFDKPNPATLAGTANNGPADVKHLVEQYKIYANHAAGNAKHLAEHLESTLLMMSRYKKRAEAAERELAARHEVDVMRMQRDLALLKSHNLKAKVDALDIQSAPL